MKPITASSIIKAHGGGDPHYVPCNEDGTEVGPKRPKKLQPNTDFARRALQICGRQYYQPGEKSRWIAIEKAQMSLASGVTSRYPSEWVEHMLTWAQKKNRTGIRITFPALLVAIENQDHIIDFVARWKQEHPTPTMEPGEIEKLETSTEEDAPFSWE